MAIRTCFRLPPPLISFIGGVRVVDIGESMEFNRNDGTKKFYTRIVTFEDTMRDTHGVVYTGHAMQYVPPLVVGQVY